MTHFPAAVPRSGTTGDAMPWRMAQESGNADPLNTSRWNTPALAAGETLQIVRGAVGLGAC